jgi:hypothetical protein
VLESAPPPGSTSQMSVSFQTINLNSITITNFLKKLDKNEKNFDSNLISEVQFGKVNFTIDMLNSIPLSAAKLICFEDEFNELCVVGDIPWGENVVEHFQKFVTIVDNGSLSKFKEQFALEIVDAMCKYAEVVANKCGKIFEVFEKQCALR